MQAAIAEQAATPVIQDEREEHHEDEAGKVHVLKRLVAIQERFPGRGIAMDIDIWLDLMQATWM